MGEVINLQDRDPHWNFYATCFQCRHKWIATVHYHAPVFKLECPKCGERDSFAAPIPREFEEINLGREENP